ncbi:hypothetical protein [Alicyclobacillus sendaiensis]|uniref:YtxH domain-containing protein n=1 Tax=Alicyclobacillus sendaiensis PA2 TaxID=3029425 RepID=A0ABT6XV52_ALISE|nr:hypothetical protein [Alicyclobacillus sendaiensis]MDI9258966.1 hypothetical protein [Alicyclobacillus sendaiensis PA2]
MSRRHRAFGVRREENRWGWPVIGGISVGLGATLLCIPQSRDALFNSIERLFTRTQNHGAEQRPSASRSPYGP